MVFPETTILIDPLSEPKQVTLLWFLLRLSMDLLLLLP
jgi:hypothetical protein